MRGWVGFSQKRGKKEHGGPAGNTESRARNSFHVDNDLIKATRK